MTIDFLVIQVFVRSSGVFINRDHRISHTLPKSFHVGVFKAERRPRAHLHTCPCYPRNVGHQDKHSDLAPI